MFKIVLSVRSAINFDGRLLALFLFAGKRQDVPEMPDKALRVSGWIDKTPSWRERKVMNHE